MPSRHDVILDFDGTLVLENSSHVFEEVLFARWTGPLATTMWQVYRGPFSPLGTLLFKALGRLSGARDARLWLLVHAARRLILSEHRRLFAETAARLSLNEELAGRYNRPFAVLSNGLEPVIRAFLVRHPQLQVTDVIASQLAIDGTRYRTTLRTVKSKVAVLRAYQPQHYLTDYPHEARLLQEQLNGYDVQKQLLANQHTVYIFEVQG